MDYSGNRAGDNVQSTGMVGISVRLIDKVHRLLTLSQRNGQAYVADESMIDTLLDVINYGVIGILVARDQWKDKAPIPNPGGLQELCIRSAILLQTLYEKGDERAKELLDAFEDYAVPMFEQVMTKEGRDRANNASKRVMQVVSTAKQGDGIGDYESPDQRTLREAREAAPGGRIPIPGSIPDAEKFLYETVHQEESPLLKPAPKADPVSGGDDPVLGGPESATTHT